MSKFRLSAVSLAYLRLLFVCGVLLLGLAAFPAHAASNQASAALHIQVTVVRTVQAIAAQPNATSSAGSVSYNLQPTTAPKMTSQVTVQQISTPGAASVKSDGKSGKGAVLQTTTVIVE